MSSVEFTILLVIIVVIILYSRLNEGYETAGSAAASDLSFLPSEYVVIYYAPWCPACKVVLKKLGGIQQYIKIPIYIKNEDEYTTPGITEYPTIIYNNNGKQLKCNVQQFLKGNIGCDPR